MKKRVLLLSLVMMGCLVGCGTEIVSSEAASSEISSSEVIAADGVTLSEESADMVVSDTLVLTAAVSPETATDKTVVWSSSDATVATVSEGTVTAVKAGKTTITAAVGDVTATCKIIVTDLPEVTGTSIAKLNAMEETDTKNIYSLTGILEGKSSADIFGNGYLTNPVSGESIKIYGSTTDISSISYAESTVKFTNPKDAVTSLADYNNGDYVEFVGIFTVYNNIPEISGYFTSHQTTTVKYDVTKAETENGSFTVDKTSAAYGETVTITCAPAEGYEIKAVKVTNAAGISADAIRSESSKLVYTFAATCVNEVTVNFIKEVATKEVAAYNLVGTSTSTADTTTLLNAFTAGADTTTEGLSDIVSNVSALDKVYLGYNSYNSFGIKLGGSSANGTFTLALSQNVVKAVVTTISWTATDTLTVGDDDAQMVGLVYNAAGATEKDLTFSFTSTDSLTFTYTKRGFISSIELYAVAE